MVCGELGLHRELAKPSQFGEIRGPWRAQTWPLDYIRLLTSFFTPILSPPSHPITATCDIITRSKKAAQNWANFGYLKLIHPLTDS